MTKWLRCGTVDLGLGLETSGLGLAKQSCLHPCV